MPEKPLLSTQGQRLLESIEGALKSCNWTSWSHGAHSDSLEKHRTPLNDDSANKIKALLRGSKLNDLSNAVNVALEELCSFETPSDTKLRVDNLNVTTAPFDAFGSLLDMLRSLGEFKGDEKPTDEEIVKIHHHLFLMTDALTKALMAAWASKAASVEAQQERERKISVILQHLTCHGALGWTDGNMPFVYTCVHPAQSHYTVGAVKIIAASVDRKLLIQAIVDLSTKSTNKGILEFSTFFLRQLIVTLSTPKDLTQAYRQVLRSMIDLVKQQQEGAAYEEKLDILYPLIRGIIFHYPRDTRNSRGGIDEVFWTSGLIESVLDLVHNENLEKNDKVDEKYRISAMTSIFSLTRVVEFRILLRDMGMLDVIIRAYDKANPDGVQCEAWDDKVSDMLMNMSEKDDIKTSLKDSEALRILMRMVENYKPEQEGDQKESGSRLFALVAIAHIYGSDLEYETSASKEAPAKNQVQFERVGTLARIAKESGLSAARSKLGRPDMELSSKVEKERHARDRDDLMKVESNMAGQLLKDNNLSNWLFDKLKQVISDGTATIKACGFTIFLTTDDIIHAITSYSSNKEAAKKMASPGLYTALIRVLKGDRARDPEDNDREVLIMTLRAIQNFTYVPELRDDIKKKGKQEEIEKALLSLQAGEEEKLDDHGQKIQDLIKGVRSNFSGKGDKTTEAVLEQIKKEGGEGKGTLFDVFLSHKRTDAKDFCRGLYTLLQADGYSCFLDFEFREELSQLSEIVARCKNFIFVLSDNIFESNWCIQELQAAVANNINIILVTKDGSRWKDAGGNPACNFPPYELIKTLPEDVQRAFVTKAIAHSDEYYQAFKDQLVRRMIKPMAQVEGAQDMPQVAEKAPPIPVAMGGRRQSLQLLSSAGSVDDGFMSDAIMYSERSIGTKINNVERSLLDHVDRLERSLNKNFEKRLTAQGEDTAELIAKLNAKFEARLKKIEEEMVASTHIIVETIGGLQLSSRGATPLSPGSGGHMALNRSMDEPLTAEMMGTSTTYTGSPMASRMSRPASARPQSGSNSPYSPQQGNWIGSAMNIRKLGGKTSSPRI